MQIEELETQLKNGNLGSLYLLYGEELFLLESSLKKIKSLFGKTIKGINYILIDENNVSELISDIETPSFGYEKKLIIVRNSGLFKKEGKRKNAELAKTKEKINNYIKENMDIIKSAVVLVFVEEDVQKQDLLTTIEKNGIVCKFDYQKPPQIEKRIKAICNGYKVNISSNTIRYFIECCGTNMQDLINEIRKLIEYAGQDGIIKKEDIDSLTVKKSESIIFDLTDNLGKKNIKESIKVLHNLINNKEPEQRILIMLYGHFKKLYIVKLSNGQNTAQYLKLKPNQSFLLNKYAAQAKYFNLEELQQILESLIYIDEASKNGNLDIQVGLESVLCNYCS